MSSEMSESRSTPAQSKESQSRTAKANHLKPRQQNRSNKPKIGDSRPAPTPQQEPSRNSSKRGGRRRSASDASSSESPQRRRNKNDQSTKRDNQKSSSGNGGSSHKRSRRRRRRRPNSEPVEQRVSGDPIELDEENFKARKGRSRKGRPVGRYLMVVSKRDEATHIAILEGRTLIEYYVSRPADNISQIHGNIYLGKVQNVLPGMEAAFVDIGTPKNAVIYRGDVQYDVEDLEKKAEPPRIEQMLKARQSILCQVTKNPIAHKGARLTNEVSLPGRFVVLVPNSETYGISKRLPDSERRRLRQILERARPKEHGIIVRTAAENVTDTEIERDIEALLQQWREIEALSKRSRAPALLYQEPNMSTRLIREEFSKEYRGVVIDDPGLYDEVSEYINAITPALADRVQLYDKDKERLPLFERYHVHEQLHKALDSKVWLPSGGSLVIESTEALTVVDVNTGKNVGSSSLEETIFHNNLEAADVIAQQLRLRDIGGIIVIDFVDMESKQNRDEVVKAFRKALSRDKTRTQVYEISDLGLAEMTRKRIGEGLLESLSVQCPHCDGSGMQLAVENA